MENKLNSYEIIGIVTPGSVLVFGLVMSEPFFKDTLLGSEVNIGGLGLFIIISYVSGHLLQAVGNLIEKAWLLKGGMPTQWLLKKPEDLITPKQYERLNQCIKENLGEAINELSKQQWDNLVREIIIHVNQADYSKRLVSFNQTYGMLRGIASAFLILLAFQIIQKQCDWQVMAGLSVCFIISVYRAHRFAIYYARELFGVYLIKCESTPKDRAG